ncbi:hypothetical protein [Glutamicibacter ardleyensis]|uniref:Terminase n=1 Tax=Glutamicibacter ardleyensis TaxID=225894 RepID=A0ABQ2DVF0_9MICC|nr:hypothetical protein [Glutamicibacter ardleyensis]GGJ74442.1 hypothetical protein GCM10007173_36760 [Glutamicibacter ardleyensis]
MLDTAPRNPPPLYGTKRNYSRGTRGGQVGKIMKAMGNTPMPWQQEALDVACEIDSRTGDYWYDTVIIVVLRRAGKTTISRGKLTHRALLTQDARMIYTAQNRLKALKRLKDDYYLPLKRSPLEMFLNKPRWRGGEEALRFINGAELAIDAVKRESGHGDANHEAHIDEAYVHRDSMLEDGVQPTMITIMGSQMWILSAAGDTTSTYLRDKVDIGRALIEAEVESRTCYIEYSAPTDADPEDPETLLGTHPALGYTIPADRVMSQRANTTDKTGWERAWLGWWPAAKGPPKLIPEGAWKKNFVSTDEGPWTGVPFWSIDVSPERDYASIAMAGRPVDSKANAYVEVFDRLEGTRNVVSEMRMLRDELGGKFVAIDGSGSALSLVQELENEGFEVIKVSGANRVAACGDFYDKALVGDLRFPDDPLLNDSMGNAVKRIVADKAFVFARGRELKDITAMYAATFARWLYIEKREEVYGADQTIL